MKLYDATKPTEITEVPSVIEARNLLKSIASVGDDALYVVEDHETYYLVVIKNSRVIPFKWYERLVHVRGILLQMKVFIPAIVHLLVVHFFRPFIPEPLGYLLAALTSLLTVYLVIRVVGGRDRSNAPLSFWLHVYETRQSLGAKGLTPSR